MLVKHSKQATRFVMALILAAGIAIAGLALAQSTSTSTTPSTDQLAALQQQAARLTLLNRLPAADRDAASSLLDKMQAVQQEAHALRVQALQAYDDALNGGADVATASAQAQQKVAAARAALAGNVASLRSAVQAFVQQHPDAANALSRYGFGQRRGFGPAAGNNPTLGYGPGMGY
ncbi:MAG: hypothetical protein P8Z81_06140, partial [Deinococcales bacterium]